MMKLEEKSKGVYLLKDFFSNAECDKFIQLSEKEGYEPSSLRSINNKNVSIRNLRNNYRLIYDNKGLAESLWERLDGELLGIMKGSSPLGLNERFRFYRYDVGELFDWHSDGYFEREDGSKSRFTFMLYLNEGFKGGETKFKKIVIKPSKGTVLVFRHDLLHQGAPVRRGRKYVLRSDVMY